jgi:hypothetical protein
VAPASVAGWSTDEVIARPRLHRQVHRQHERANRGGRT